MQNSVNQSQLRRLNQPPARYGIHQSGSRCPRRRPSCSPRGRRSSVRTERDDYGTVLDAESGESLIGGNVIIEGTAIGSTTDLDGHFTIKSVAPGSYNLVFSYIGYHSTTVRSVEVVAGRATTINLSLTPEAIGMDEVVVEAEAIRNSEGALLRERQKAAAVSDAISAQAIGRSGSPTAADAMSSCQCG